MTELWPWLSAAGAGALHGLHPMGGWALGAAWGLRRGTTRKAHRTAFAAGLALCALLALQDAGHSMAPLLWGLCTGLPGAASWAMAASLVAVHVAAWLAVSAALAAGACVAASPLRRWLHVLDIRGTAGNRAVD